MSIQRCEHCERDIDLDFNSEHFQDCGQNEINEEYDNFVESCRRDDCMAYDFDEWKKEIYEKGLSCLS